MATSTKIFVGSLSPGVKPQELRRLFESYGVVTECDVMNRCGFVHMETVEMAENAIKALNATPFKGQTIVVEPGRPKDSTKKGKATRSGDRRRNRRSSSSKRRRRNRNPENRRNQTMMQSNDNNPNINSEEALQLCSALFLEVSKMLKPGTNVREELFRNGNDISTGRNLAIESNQTGSNSQISNAAKNPQVRKRGGRRHNRPTRVNHRQSGGGFSGSSDNDSNRNKPLSHNSIGHMRSSASKSLRNVIAAPYNKSVAKNNSNNYNQISRGGQSLGDATSFGVQGSYKNKVDQSKLPDVWQSGTTFNSKRESYGDGHNGMIGSNNMGGMNSNSANFNTNNMIRERFRGNGSSGNIFIESFGMGNQDRRGFALPENRSFDFNGQQIGIQQQQSMFRSSNQTIGRNFLSNNFNVQNSMFNNNPNNSNEAIFSRRGDNFGSQSINNSNLQNFEFDNQISGINRGNNFSNTNLSNDPAGGSFGSRNIFENNFTDGRNMGNNSRNFQNDFPPLGFSDSDLITRNLQRQSMMNNRRFN